LDQSVTSTLASLDNYICSNLATLLPNVTSFVYTGQAYFGTVAIQLAPRPELKRLTFQHCININQFQALVVAFPDLRHLSIFSFKNNNGSYSDDDEATGVNMETPMYVLEYPSLESFVFTNDFGHRRGHIIKLLTSRIRFSRIKEMKSYAKIVGPSLVRQAL
jgi:hypothetical protein